ncbi:FliG [Desulforapulum autotrophicum HRM2]|uniref:Flagellar motor switch protein FliG n=1 Tax=Desulforapulum autotrophicum (strain ATCC 43914 / DSM 3382 / VKM B-1955 / HRM2) TaxID=177437 RepID=C0QAK3_DESAH|nr:flagellar motor switch protein FliG [Desulforapulum autotrophicum]ACN16786.1 FliG [Desulforapulum autotrophicum HRM2]
MAPVIDPEKMTGAQKAAVFMLAMGEAYAAKIFERMNDQEIRAVAFEMSKIDFITPGMLEAVSLDFVTRFEGENNMVVEGNSFVKHVISSSLDKEKADAIFKDVENRKRDMPFVWSRGVNVATMASYIEGEHPQTIAMVLAHMPSDIASEILMQVPDEKKGDIALRVAKLGQISEDVVRDVDRALKDELSGAVGPGGKAGGLQVLVDIINGVDKASEDIIMEFVEEDSSEMANDIRNMMFVFEDMVSIDDRAMREILKKVEGQQLTYALKTSTDEMKTKIFSNLSQRAGEMLKDDLDTMGPVRLAEVEEAQQAIVRAAKELEADGTITLGGKGKDDVLV